VRRCSRPAPFPGMGQQTRFRDEMARIIPVLPKIGVFLARAWKAANDKARELGWIV
jgi:hypothetical protein